MDESSKDSTHPDVNATADKIDDPVHVFDQTNGLMPSSDSDAAPVRGKKHQPTDAEIALGSYTVVSGARGTF